jgi:polyhydroxyalkanoate synthesis regulator phasin
MNLTRTTKVLAAVAILLIAAGAGVAIAASDEDTRTQDSEAIIDAAAKELGISSGDLSDALKNALQERIDAAVDAGRLTETEGEALKERIQSEAFPLFGLHHRGGHGFIGKLEAAAQYLGLSESELRQQLEDGKSLADIARDQGKSVEGLVDALVAAAKQKLDQAVDAGRLTQQQADEMLDHLKDRVESLVEATPADRPQFRDDYRFRFRGGPFS